MKTKFLFILSLSVITLGYGQKKWTLKECVDHALENNITIKQNILNLDVAEENAQIANGSFLPGASFNTNSSFNSGLSQDQSGVLRNTNNINLNGNIGLNGTIFNGFVNLNSYKQAKLGVESSKLDLERIKNDISLRVVNTYLNVLFAQENLAVAEVQAKISKEQIKAAKARYEAGLIPKGDYLNTQSTAANDAQNLVSRQNALQIALLNLSQLLQIPSEGFDVEPVDIKSLDGIILYEDSETVFEKALDNQPSIKRAELAIDNAQYNIDIAKGAFLPTLSYRLGAGSSYFNQFNNLFPGQSNDYLFRQLRDRLQYSASLSLSVPIFNRFQTKNRVERSIINKKLSELDLENQKLQLEQDIEQALVDAKAAVKTYEAATVSLSFQQEAFKNAQESYNLGATTLFDFDLIRNRLIGAESSVIRAKYDYLFKSKVLEFFYLGYLKL